MTTPRALSNVPKMRKLSVSSSFNLICADRSIVKGAIQRDLIKVLLPSGCIYIFYQEFVSTLIRYWSYPFAASEYYLAICKMSFMNGEATFTTRSFISITIWLIKRFFTNELSIYTSALNMDLGLSFGSEDVNCLYLIGVIITGLGMLKG